MAHLFVLLQRLLPKRALSDVVGWLTRRRGGFATRVAIRLFVRAFGVDMSEAADPDPAAYATFNAFFTRALRPGARPLATPLDTVVSPADGRVSACGSLEGGRLLQAKGVDYSLLELCDGDEGLAAVFQNGSFCTIYLAPYDYHRVHMPLDGRLEALRYVPGALFSVNAITTTSLPRLFCRNERVLTVFDDDGARFALVMVGALNVGSIELTMPATRPFANRPSSTWPAGVTQRYASEPRVARGAEYGRFNMGSTVILLAAPGVLSMDNNARAGRKVRMGEAIGRRLRT